MFECFRPQQGLPIMNRKADEWVYDHFDGFPSPTGVTYYELKITSIMKLEIS